MPSDRHPTRRRLPAAASTLVAPLVAGADATASVLGVHRFALYLSVGASVLPVLTSDAVPLPTAVRLGVRSGDLAWGVVVGDAVRVGAGRIALPGADVVVARTWRPARVTVATGSGFRCPAVLLSGPLGTALATPGGTGSGWLADGIRAVFSTVGCPGGRRSSQVSTRLADAERTAAVAALVGRGEGLTPSGDDALAGALLVSVALGTGTALADAVRARLATTTAVSAALLDAAADGRAARPVVTLVDAAVAGDRDAVARALPAVLAIGHTSGADTVTGIRAALECGVGCRGGRGSGHRSTRLEKPSRRSAA